MLRWFSPAAQVAAATVRRFTVPWMAEIPGRTSPWTNPTLRFIPRSMRWDLPPDGSSLFAGNDGGIWTSADVTNTSVAAGSQTWTNLNTGSTTSGLSITQFYPGLTVHPSSDSVAFGGTQGNSPQLYNTNAWTGMAAAQCDGGYTAIDATIPNTVFTTCGDLQQPPSVVPIRLPLALGGFANDFVVAENGINTSDPASYLPPIARRRFALADFLPGHESPVSNDR